MRNSKAKPTRVQVLLAQGAVGRAIASALTLLDDFLDRRQSDKCKRAVGSGNVPPIAVEDAQALLSATALATAAGARDDLTREVLSDYAARLGA